MYSTSLSVPWIKIRTSARAEVPQAKKDMSQIGWTRSAYNSDPFTKYKFFYQTETESNRCNIPPSGFSNKLNSRNSDNFASFLRCQFVKRDCSTSGEDDLQEKNEEMKRHKRETHPFSQTVQRISQFHDYFFPVLKSYVQLVRP